MIHELRVYRCLPGKLPNLLIGPSNQELTYLLAWESLAEREAKWTAFQSDPEWISKRAETERDGQIVANIECSLLQPTAFSTVK
jgi:hypothetical protein